MKFWRSDTFKVSLKPPNVEILELLLAQEKIDVNIKSSDFTDRTPLYLACMDSVIPREIVELLIVKDKTTVNVLTKFKVLKQIIDFFFTAKI